jgi:hypothetical protein
VCAHVNAGLHPCECGIRCESACGVGVCVHAYVYVWSVCVCMLQMCTCVCDMCVWFCVHVNSCMLVNMNLHKQKIIQLPKIPLPPTNLLRF